MCAWHSIITNSNSVLLPLFRDPSEILVLIHCKDFENELQNLSALVNFVNVLFILYKWQENENHCLTYLRVPLPLCHFLCPPP